MTIIQMLGYKLERLSIQANIVRLRILISLKPRASSITAITLLVASFAAVAMGSAPTALALVALAFVAALSGVSLRRRLPRGGG